MAVVAMAKLRFLSMRKSTTGSFVRSSQITPATTPISINTKKKRMKSDANQSSRWPLSRIICMLPRPRLISPRPM